MALMAFTACETDPTDLLSKDAVAPVMDEHAAILMTPNTPDETVTFTWKGARNLSGTVNYFLYAQLDGQDLQLAKTEATFFTANKSALRQQLLGGFNLAGNENFDLSIYVVADNGVQALKSEAQLVKVYVYGDYMPAEVSIAAHISAEGLVLNDQETEEQTLLTWTPARFENGQTITYRVELELNDGFRVQLATGLEKTEFATTWPKLNSVLLKNGFAKDKQYELSFLVTAMSEATPDFDGEWLESEPVKLLVTTYTPAFPDFLYVIGDFCGHDGLNTLEKAPILKGDANEGVYHGVVTIYGGKAEFYYINPRTVNDPEPKKVFVGGATENGASPYYWTISTDVEDDELAPQDGTYAFYVNLNDEYIRAFKITSVGLIGEKGLINGITDDWGKEAQFTFNETTFCYELAAKFSKSEGQYKVRLNNNWNKPFPELNGGNDVSEPGYNFGQEPEVEHDPTTLVTLAWDQMGENIVSAAGGYNVTIDFSTNRNYELQFEQTAVVNEYGVSGDYNQWGADSKDRKFVADESQEGWYKLSEFEVKENEQFIFRLNDADKSTWGMESADQTAEADKVYTLKAGGEKFTLAVGKYDLFFNPTTLEFKATVSGAYYGLCGEHNNWGPTDPQFVDAEEAGWLVLKSFEATAGKMAKIRMNDSWDKNWGLTGAEIAVGERYTLEFNVDNFKWAASGTYDIYFNPSTLEFYIEEGKAKVYTLYGAFNGKPGWEDFEMTKQENGYYKAANMTTTDDFKFLIHADYEWNEKFGASAAVELNTAATLELNGGDIALSAAAGTYDFYFNPTTATLYVVVAGSADPTVPVEPVEVLYGLVGQHNGWGPDQPEGTSDPQFVEAVNKEGWLVLKNFEATADNEAKVRTKDAWAQDWGLAGASIAVGEHYTLVAYDGNFKWATTGLYDVYFNPTTLEFYIEEAAGDVYTLVGSMNEWNLTDDTYTFQKNSEGKLELKGVTFATASDFKVVENYSWDNADYGGALENGVVNLQLDQMVNITIEAGVYDMLLDLDALKLYVTKVADVEPTETVYSLYGAFNNATDWGDTDLTKADNGYYTATNVVVGSDNFEFLIRTNHAWAEKFGKGEVIPIGTATTLVVGGDNMKIAAAGTYDFYFNPTTKVLYILTAGSALPADTKYSLAGSMNGWAAGDQTYTFQNENGKLVLKDMTFSTDGEFKVVTDYSWDNANYGGTLNNGEVALNTAGGNIAIATGIYDMELDIAALKLYVTKVGDPAPVEDVYYLAGTHNEWNGADANSQFTEGANGLMELKNITFGAGGKFKVVKNGSWYGGVLSNGEVMLGSGDDVAIAEGTYDFYLDTTTMKLTVVTAGSAAPGTPTTVYGLVGEHNGWGANGDDTPFAEYQNGYFKATQALIANKGFKVRGYNDSSWNLADLNFGYPGANTVIPVGELFTVEQGKGSKDMMVAADGTYDLYLNPTTKQFLVVTTGTTPNI